MKRLSLIFLFCASAAAAVAQRVPQNPVFNEWDEKPAIHPVEPQFANLSAYYILHSISNNYKYEGRHTTMYRTQHTIIKVLDTKGIESFNTVSIPVYHNSKIQTIKARTILQNGKVYDIPREKIKVTTNENGVYEVVIALDGVTKNAEIECLVKEIKQAWFVGWDMMQYKYPVQNTWFEMDYPKEFFFEQKGFNGFPTAKEELLKTNRKQIKIYVADIPALEKESYNFYDLYRMRSEYRLNMWAEEGDEKVRVNTWDDVARDIHKDYYKWSDTEKNTANRFLSTIGVTNNSSDLDKVRKIEDGIKKNIVMYDDVEYSRSTNLDSVITNKAATPYGMVKLFAACLSLAHVQHEIGLTTNRWLHKFEPGFENQSVLEYAVIYLPSLNMYLMPTTPYYRMPFVSEYVIGNKGVFCMMPPEGNLTGQISELRTIPHMTVNENIKSIKADITFSKEMDAQADLTYSFAGYCATAPRSKLLLTSGDRKEEAIKKMIPLAEKPEYILKYNTAHEGMENYTTNTPLEVTATVQAPQLVEKADKKYLFKIGEVMGRQQELYRKTERKLPVDIDYPYTQYCVINVTIPKGYKIMNPVDLRKQADYVDANGKPIMSFKADYTLKGDKLTVTINEYYRKAHYPVTEYERYRSVINASADFNKVTLVLAKK